MESSQQTGAEALVHTLIAGGVDTCFANPGTSEMHFVAALDRIPGIRCILGLQENIVTGMADGYFRVTGKPAATLLHCGPGYANGIANIHNARRAGSGMLNIVGDHATAHVAHDSPLTADVDALVGATSHWHAFGRDPAHIGDDAARALQAAQRGYGQIASLVLPADVSWGAGGQTAAPLPSEPPLPPHHGAVEKVAGALRGGGRVVMVLGSPALSADLHETLHAIAQQSGVTLMASGTVSSLPRGRGRLAIPPVPYAVDEALIALQPFDVVVLVNCPPPVGFFLYPGRPSRMHRPDAELLVLSREDQDARAALQALALELGAAAVPLPAAASPADSQKATASLPATSATSDDAITAQSFAEVVAAAIPGNAIVVSEALTLGAGFGAVMPYAAPCDWFSVTGGAIGGGIPLATGAASGARAIGEGQRRVIALQADGSAAYTIQGLWTQAREKLPVTTLLLNNRAYAILLGEYAKVGATPGPTAADMMSLSRPDIGWAEIARGFGLQATTVTDLVALRNALDLALSLDGPMLIDVCFA